MGHEKLGTIAVEGDGGAAAAGNSRGGVTARACRGMGPDTPLVGILPPEDILAAVRYFGLEPEGAVVRRDGYYVLHAFDGTGIELRIVADAQFGDILFMGPAFNASLTPPYIRAAHVIHVPQPGESDEKKK